MFFFVNSFVGVLIEYSTANNEYNGTVAHKEFCCGPMEVCWYYFHYYYFVCKYFLCLKIGV